MDTKEKERAVEIFGLVVKSNMLPEKLEKLVPLSFIGQAAVTFYRAKVKAMTDLGMTEDQQKATLSDGQDAGKMLLAIEARIGELLPTVQEAMKLGGKHRQGQAKDIPLRPEGINKDRAKMARTIMK